MVRAVFPGTFDPIHNGHIDIASRAVRLFDELIIAVYDNPPKNLLFSAEERCDLAREVFAKDDRIRVESFGGLIVCERHNHWQPSSGVVASLARIAS